MFAYAFVYHEIQQSYEKIHYRELINRLEAGDPQATIMKEHLYLEQNKRMPLVIVKQRTPGFRRKAVNTGNHDLCARGSSETPSHLYNKELLSTLSEFDLKFNDEKVKVYVDYSEVEKTVNCNGRKYQIDIYFKLIRTEPAKYYDIWNGELWFEVFHKCAVDYRQAEDFKMENKALFEIKLTSDYVFFDQLSIEKINLRKETLKRKYLRDGISGMLFIRENGDGSSPLWHLSSNGNWTTSFGGIRFTIIKNAKNNGYAIVYGENKYSYKFNGKEFLTIDDATKAAEYYAHQLYNNKKIANDKQ